MCLLAVSMSSLEKWSSSHFLMRLFGSLVLSCVSSLYILDINPLSDIWLATIFSYSIGCLFILLLVFIAVQKLFGLM